jgi:hypothetical protein
MPDVRGAFPNIDRRTMTAGRYEGATAEEAVPFPKRRPLISLCQHVHTRDGHAPSFEEAKTQFKTN